eukprot:TRINITY_DN52791_c0_g1_i1.p1 TRINITY_DN52791_c0_g1~~TRINITY_DN52791_c0_g1_i1.p1  ORF type:complete len:199 (+),score=52.71 TRINITY_DN52791_c0_g1_i1:64-597(+)
MCIRDRQLGLMKSVLPSNHAAVLRSIKWLNQHALQHEGIWRKPGKRATLRDSLSEFSEAGIIQRDSETPPVEVCDVTVAMLKEINGLIDPEAFDGMLQRGLAELEMPSGDCSSKDKLLQVLIKHWATLVCNTKQNRMTPNALATCTFPLVFGAPGRNSPIKQQMLSLIHISEPTRPY